MLIIAVSSHNPYFNRWFSAINQYRLIKISDYGHNPYFNRWFSAIIVVYKQEKTKEESQSLF